MKKVTKFLTIAVGALLAVAPLAACGEEKVPQITRTARICYDNVNDGISIPEEDTKLTVEGGATNIKARNNGNVKNIVSYDSKTKTFTAKGKGSVTFDTPDGETTLLEVVPAYVTDPGDTYRYTGDSEQDIKEGGAAELLGGTHDPSLIEVIEKNRPVWYIVSTGWNYKTTLDDDTETWGNPIYRSTDLINWELQGRTFDESLRGEEFEETAAGDWLYGGTTNGYGAEDASWWAPDIVKCPSGGYWLYTCVVDGAGDKEGMALPGGVYARACILLYHSDTLEAGTFKPVLFPEGHADAGKPVVLMQSSILRGESVKDVNGIDPQIIYTPEGKMYMAYGSFGSGNYIIELDPETGLRKDGEGWQTHDEIRGYVDEIQPLYNKSNSIGWEHAYYGTNISKNNMEAPVIARHDNVTVMDENEQVLESGKTYYYSMHSYNGLGDDYQMWGGRSESVTGVYRSATGEGIVYNAASGSPAQPSNATEGNKYMGAFKWAGKDAKNKEIDVILTGHNDLFTTVSGTSVAAYITRTTSYGGVEFCVQIHQYYLNSMGQIVINPNRYAGEISRAVSEEELLAYTENGKFKMVVYGNTRDTSGTNKENSVNVSRDVILTEDHTITEANGTALGTWKMYGNGYIKFTFNAALKGTGTLNSMETVYYGVVRPAWLGDQQRSGFTITCLGQTGTNKRSMTMFMNNYSTLEGSKLVYEFE